MWSDIAMIVFSATLANSMGLIEAIEGVIKHKLPIINCVRCCVFWSVLIYTLICGTRIIPSVAISFLASYIAVWFELSLGLIDKIYNYVYQSAFADTEATDTEDTEGKVSKL